MKKILFLTLSILICASSLAACVDKAPNVTITEESSKPAQSTAPVQSTAPSASSKPAESPKPAESSKPTDESKEELSITEDKFFNSLDYQYLQYAAFAVYKSEVADIDTEPTYCFETVQYDEATNTAVVQIPCQKDGSVKYMTITMSRPLGSTKNDWEKQSLEYKDRLNTNNLVGADNQFIIDHYPQIQSVAFQFFRAYIQADTATAIKLLDGGKNNLCLSYFNTTDKGSLKDITAIGFELVNYKYNEETGKGNVVIDIPYTPKGDDSLTYMTLSIDTVDETDENGKTTKKCTVFYFDFEA